MAKNVFTIPSQTAFLTALADGLLERYADRARLADMRIYLPTRRACRLLRGEFLKASGGEAMLLPRLQPIGDVDEEELILTGDTEVMGIPPAITPLRRRLLLAQLVQKRDPNMELDQAVRLAEALAQFLDEAQIRRCDFTRLPDLVQNRELAAHWQETVRFLGILTEVWPQILVDEGCIDPADRRNRLLATQVRVWRERPPTFPIVAAGSTGTMPATAEFLDAIAGLSDGMVILPGLDQVMHEEMWQAVDELHPQHGMKELIAVMDIKRHDVRVWHGPSDDTPRLHLLREATRPASVSEGWRDLKNADIPQTAVAGFARATFAHPQEEAQGIALMLRQALDIPDQQIALVTPDRALAERVLGLLARWGIVANDSAGTSMAEQPVGGFLSALLDAAAPQADAVAWLSLLKHPLAACGLTVAECRSRARQTEITHWRTDRPEAVPWLDEVKTLLAPLSSVWTQRRHLIDWLDDHRCVAEVVAASADEKGAERLWHGEAGDSAVAWFDDLRCAAAAFPPINGATYANLFVELLRQARFRPSYGQHPRLSILGPLEARLIRPDVVVLGGMNEGVWPPEVSADPWMSRPMKKDFGMSPPEHRIGLSAHDFVQLAAAPRVMLTRSRRAGGAPSVPSRFLLQLETVLRALGHSGTDHDALASMELWAEWAQALDEPPANTIKSCAAPEPRPPSDLRPKQLSVTDVGLWQRNPYAIYAKYVLGLRKLDELEAPLDAADRGNLIHEALERFVTAYPHDLPPDAFDKLMAIGGDLFQTYEGEADIQAFWWPRFQRIADWFVGQEREHRATGAVPLGVEKSGRMVIQGLTLKGRADRIDRLPDGNLVIVDYKTGTTPSKKEVEAGLEPQLPLLALIAMQGGFDDMATSSTGAVAYWKMTGGRSTDANKEIIFQNVAVLQAEAEAGLKALITHYGDEKVPYRAVPKPGRAPRYDDYAHLARLAEWGRTQGD
jgi:ATP-dependent helicase/nuclease subunit B